MQIFIKILLHFVKWNCKIGITSNRKSKNIKLFFKRLSNVCEPSR
jgi:hypothetical protein